LGKDILKARIAPTVATLFAAVTVFASITGSAWGYTSEPEGARLDTSSWNGVPHVVVAWPTTAGELYVEATSDENGATSTWTIDVIGDLPADLTIASPCVKDPPSQITCTISNTELAEGIEIWTGNTGRDTITISDAGSAGDIAPSAVFPRGSSTGDSQQVTGGRGQDLISTGEENTGTPSATWMIGGPGQDTFIGAANSRDIVSYGDAGRVGNVVAKLDCIPNDGNYTAEGNAYENVGCSTTSIEGLEGSINDDLIVGDGASNQLYGLTGNDTIRGGDLTDSLSGGNGDDTLDGGTGSDFYWGDESSNDRWEFQDGLTGDGADTVSAADGVTDHEIDCGGAADVADVDDAATDTASITNCETVNRAASGGGGNPAETDPTKRFTVPDYKPKFSRKHYRFKTLSAARKDIRNAGINVLAGVKYQPLKLIPRALRPDIEDGDIFSQQIAPGTELTAGIAPPYPELGLKVYREALDYRGQRCPYNKPKRMKQILNAIDDAPLTFAQSYLKRNRCVIKRVKDIIDKSATDATIRSANVFNRKTRRGRELAVSLLVQRPPRQDFRINITERPPHELKSHPNFKNEIGIGADGKLTAGLAPAVLHFDLFEVVTGRKLRGLEVKIVRSDEVVLASTKTNNSGGMTFTVPVDFTGELDIRVNVDVSDEGGFKTLEAWHSIDVVYRKQKPFYTKSGRYFKFSKAKNKYLPAKSPVTVSAVHKQIADRMRDLSQGLAGNNPLFAQAAGILSNTSAPPQQLLQDVANNVGLLPGALLAGKEPDGKVTGATFTNAPAVQIGPGGGLLAATMPVALLPATGDIDTATLIGQDGGSLIGLDGGSLVGQDGGSLVGLDGGSLTTISGSDLIGLDGGSLQTGMKLISDKGVGLGGNGFVPVRP
jgi:hypothetical protein